MYAAQQLEDRTMTRGNQRETDRKRAEVYTRRSPDLLAYRPPALVVPPSQQNIFPSLRLLYETLRLM